MLRFACRARSKKPELTQENPFYLQFTAGNITGHKLDLTKPRFSSQMAINGVSGRGIAEQKAKGTDEA